VSFSAAVLEASSFFSLAVLLVSSLFWLLLAVLVAAGELAVD
jgi:hypothetical protein